MWSVEVEVHSCKMGLSEVETPPQPSAARQSPFRWSYEKHGRLEDSRAELATSFASVVLPLFWKSKLDGVQLASSGHPPPRRGLFQHSVTTEDLAVLRSLENYGTSTYSTAGKRYCRRREAGIGMLTAVRSEGDLRCKYSAALSTARCFDPELDNFKSGGPAETDCAAVKSSLFWDRGVQLIPQRSDRFRIASGRSHHSAHCIKQRGPPQTFTSAERLKEPNQTHSFITYTATNEGSNSQNAPPPILPSTPASTSMQSSAHARHLAESRMDGPTGGNVVQQGLHRQRDVSPTELLFNGTCSSTSESKPYRPLLVRQDRKTTQYSGMKLSEDSKRTELEKAHGRMREHMADMLRFLDRMQGKHVRRRTTAAFRLRAAKLSDGPRTISYAARHCLTGVAGSLLTGRENARESYARRDVATEETPRTAPLQQPANDAAAGREREDAGKEVQRHTVAVSMEERRTKQWRRYSCATKKVENQAAVKREYVYSAAETAAPALTAAPTVAAENVVEAELEDRGAARARLDSDAGRRESLSAAASLASASSEKPPMCVQVTAGTRNTQGSVVAGDAGPSTVTGVTSRQEGTIAGKGTLAVPSALETAIVLAKQRWVPAGRRSKERGRVVASWCGACRTCSTATSDSVACAKTQHTPAAVEAGDEVTYTEGWLTLRTEDLEMRSGENDLRRIASMKLLEAVTGEREGNDEEHRSTGVLVYDGGQQVKCGDTPAQEEQNPRTAEPVWGGVLSGEAALSDVTGMAIDNIQVEPIPDAAIAYMVANRRVERHSCVQGSWGRGDRSQRLEPAQAEALYTGGTQVAEEKPHGECGLLVTKDSKRAREGNASTGDELRAAFPATMSRKEIMRAECQMRPEEEAFAETAKGEGQSKPKLGSVLEYNHVLLDLHAAPQLHSTRILQQGRVEIEQVGLAAGGAKENAADIEREQQKPSERMRPPASGKIPEEASQRKQGALLEKNINTTARGKDHAVESHDGTQVGDMYSQSAALNTCAEPIYVKNAHNANKANERRASEVSAEEVNGTVPNCAQMSGTRDNSSTAHAAENSRSAANTLVEIRNPGRSASGSKVLPVKPEKSVERITTSPRFIIRENTEEIKRACSEKDIIPGVIPPAQEDALALKCPQRVPANVGHSHAPSAVGNTRNTAGISNRNMDVSDLSAPAASDSGHALVSIEESRRLFGERLSTRNGKAHCNVEEGRGGLHSTCLSVEQRYGEGVVYQDDFCAGITVHDGNSMQTAATTFTGQRDRPPLDVTCSSDKDNLFRKSPVPADETEKVENTAEARQCQTSADTSITRIGSRASTVPSSFGTVCLSSQEDLFGEEVLQGFSCGRTGTETPERCSVATEQQWEAQVAPGATPDSDSFLAGAPETRHGLEFSATAAVGSLPHTMTKPAFAVAKQMSAQDRQTSVSLERDDDSISTKDHGNSMVKETRRSVTCCASAHSGSVENDSSDHAGSSTALGKPGDAGGADEGISGNADVCSHKRTEHLSTFDEGRTVDEIIPPAEGGCKLCSAGDSEQQYVSNVATCVPPFLRHRGSGGAYTNQELVMLSGGFWYGDSGLASFRVALVPPRRQDHAFLASQAAGRRARAIQQNLLLSIEREMRLSRCRLRSMFYWPKSFIHSCASAVHTKATMMAAGSLVGPSRQPSFESERCCHCLPSTSTTGASLRFRQQFNSAEVGQSACYEHTGVCQLHELPNRGERCEYTLKCLSLENLALMDCSNCCNRDSGNCPGTRAQGPRQAAPNVGTGVQRLMPSASRAQRDGLQQEIASQNPPFKDLQHTAVEQSKKGAYQEHGCRSGRGTGLGDECRLLQPLLRQAKQQSIVNSVTHCSPSSYPVSDIACRPPLVARWSLTDAEIVEVAGTFSSPPWKDRYRMHQDRELGGFILDLYSVAAQDMLPQQERFSGLCVDDRHKHVLPRGWWVCPLYPKEKTEAVLQIALKFRVDGVWRCEPMLPIHRDEQGRSVNVLVVYQGQHVASRQKGRTQYFFEGLDLSPLTYNPSRSPAYQTDGPILVHPSAAELELEDTLMSYHRRCWNPPSCRPLMSIHCGLTIEALRLSWAADALEAVMNDEHIGTYGTAQNVKRARDGVQETRKEEAKKDVGELRGRVRETSDAATGSGEGSMQLPQTTIERSQRKQRAKHKELEHQQRLVADGAVQTWGEISHADSASQQLDDGDGELMHHPVLPSQPEKDSSVLKTEDIQRVLRSGAEHQERQHNDQEAADEQRTTAHLSYPEAGKAVRAQMLASSGGEKSEEEEVRNTNSPQGRCLDVSNKVSAAEERAAEQMHHPVCEGEEACSSGISAPRTLTESSQEACSVAFAQSFKRIRGPQDQVDAVLTGAEAAAPAIARASLRSHESALAERTGEEGERQKALCVSGSDEVLGDGIGRERKAEQVAARLLSLEELETGPAGEIGAANARAAPRRRLEARAAHSSIPELVAGSVGPGKGGARAGAGEMCASLNTLREGKTSATAFAPRLNRGFSAYGSTLAVAKDEQTAAAGVGNYPVKSPATGALRRVSTLGDGYWPTRVTKYLQTPEIFHELSGIDVAGRRTPNEGARLRRGLTLQCSSYMIPHPDKTESGGADAFFLATPVPPSSRYAKRFACMDVPLARSSTPPLRSIPPSRQRGRYTVPDAENGNFDDRSSRSFPHTVDMLTSATEVSDDSSAIPRPSIIALLASPASYSHSASTKPRSPDSSTNTCEPLLHTLARSAPDKSQRRSVDATSPASEVPTTTEGLSRQPQAKATWPTTVSVETRVVEAPTVPRRGPDPTALLSLASPAESSPSRHVNKSVPEGTSSITFSSGTTESGCSFKSGNELPEDEASGVQMLLRHALGESTNSGLAQVLSAFSPLSHGMNGAATGEYCKDERGPGDYSVCGSFLCAGAATCTPPRRPPGAPLMIAGGYGSAAKGVVIGSGGELGGAVCVGVADGVGEWDSFGLNPRLFAEELMRGCWEAAHEEWFWEVAAVEKRALEVLKRGYKAARSFGSSTALVACLDTRSEKLGIANLGDSGVIVLRRQHQPRLVYSKMTCVHRSKEQQHNFNCPYQLSRLPSPSQYQQLVNDGKHSLVRVLRSATMLSQDTPEMADVYTVNTLEGDLILLGTDGVFDNLFDHEICALANAALSPYEAALLNKESLATSADAVAAAVAEAAAHRR